MLMVLMEVERTAGEGSEKEVHGPAGTDPARDGAPPNFNACRGLACNCQLLAAVFSTERLPFREAVPFDTELDQYLTCQLRSVNYLVSGSIYLGSRTAPSKAQNEHFSRLLR